LCSRRRRRPISLRDWSSDVCSSDLVDDFYAALPRPVTVGIESTGYAIWFHALLQRLGHTVLVGDAAKIRAMVVRKTKTDRRDAPDRKGGGPGTDDTGEGQGTSRKRD